MARRVFILQSDRDSLHTLSQFFVRQKDQVWQASNKAQALEILRQQEPTLALIDLHLPEADWLEVVRALRREQRLVGIIATNKRPDVRMELVAREQGIRVFLRAPFAAAWIERALEKLDSPESNVDTESFKRNLPRVRIPLRWKITGPYSMLALIFFLAALYLAGHYVSESIQTQFNRRLADAGLQSAAWINREEQRLTATLRLVTRTEGVAAAVIQRDIPRLQQMLLPLATHYQEEALEILDVQGTSLLSMHRRSGAEQEAYDIARGDIRFATWPLIQPLLHGEPQARADPYAGVVSAPWGRYLYVAGPLLDERGEMVGVILIGKSLASMARQMRQEVLAQVTFYDLKGNVQVSTLFLPQKVFPVGATLAARILQKQGEPGTVRDFKMSDTPYSEMLTVLETHAGEKLGLVGVALEQNFYTQPAIVTAIEIFLVLLVTFLSIIVLGVVVARQVTRPLARVVEASAEVAEGNFQVKLPSSGQDEVMVLTHAFNFMVTEMQESSIYRDLLGRSVSLQERDILREAFATGTLKLEGRNTVATVLMSDIRNFTGISEKEEPTIILKWLNEYFGELVPIVTRHSGVVDKFEGDAMLAFFGILPAPLSPEESAYQACQAAVEILAVVEEINRQRVQRGEPALHTGIGINTGTLTAGGLGASDRMNFTIIGDTVNSTHRLQGMTREFGESGAVAGENTVAALHGRRGDFRLDPLGQHAFKGKSELLWVYRLLPYTRPQPVSRRNGRASDELLAEALEPMPADEGPPPGEVELPDFDSQPEK